MKMSIKDLTEAVSTLDIEIEYLEKTIPTYEKGHKLRVRLVERYNKLLNSRNWIVEQIAKEKK